MQIGASYDRPKSSRIPKPRRLSHQVLKRCSEAVLRDPETLGKLLLDPRSLQLILHESSLARKLLLDPEAIERVARDPNFLVTLSESEHLLDYLRRHPHLLDRLMDDRELIAMVAQDTRFIEHLLRDQISLATLLDDERTLHLFARSKSRMVRLAVHRDFAKLLSEEPVAFARLIEYPPLQEFLATHAPLLAANARSARGSRHLREALLNDPENLERLASDDRILRSILAQPVSLDRILQSDRARTRMLESRKFLDQLIDDPGFIAELFLDPRVVRKLLNNRMLLRGLLQDESIQTALLECMPTASPSPLSAPAPSTIPAEPEDPISLGGLLRSPEIASVFTADDDLVGCLLENAELCQQIAAHPILLRTLDEMGGHPRVSLPAQDSHAIESAPSDLIPVGARDRDEFVFSFDVDEPTRARRELTRYWNEFLPHLDPGHSDFLTRFQRALNQLVSREQISDTLVQVLNDDGEVHLRGASLSLLAGSKLPDLLYQVLVAGRYRFEATTDSPRILDCGAQAGLATYGFKLQYPNARITTVEPAPSLRQASRANLKAAGHDDVEHLAYALATERGPLPFLLPKDANHGGVLVHAESSLASSGKTLSVRGRRLSDLLRDPVDFLKLDVAGAEVDILTDAEPELGNVKQLFVEVHDRTDDFPDRLARLFSILTRSGFTTRVVAPVGPTHLIGGGTTSGSSEVFGVSARRLD